MKAFLLSAGLGTRLRPLTDVTPKCLLPIAGTPLLGHWLMLLQKACIDSVLINTHHLHEQVGQFAQGWSGTPRVTLAYEPELLGSAGTIAHNRDFLGEDDTFFILYADNLTNIDLRRLLLEHRQRRSTLTVAAYRTNNPTQKGIFAVEEGGRVVSFEEKPKNPKSNLANSGIAVADRRILNLLHDKLPSDLGYDVMPQLVGQMYAIETDRYIRDIGSHQDYMEANEEWQRIVENHPEFS
jgi:mannose-1-phosphate guanylyltransferase